MAKRIIGWAYAAVLLVFFVSTTVFAVANLVGVTSVRGASLSGLAWALLILNVAAPVIALLAALLLGRKRGGGSKLLLLTAALCAVAVVQLDVFHLLFPIEQIGYLFQ